MTNSKGILLFAYNTEFDYVKIANICAALTKKFAGLPVTIVTDTFGALQADKKFIDNVIIDASLPQPNKRGFRMTHDESIIVTDWKNLTRVDAYELSPYDQTLLLDVDYLMFNDNLVNLFELDVEFTCFDKVYDISGMDIFRNDIRLSQYSVPMLWATVIYFRKGSFAKSIFDMMKLVKENYKYYSKVYGFKQHPFRNDFALSIAYHALSGYGLDELIPYNMIALSPMTDVIDFRDDGSLLYQYKKGNIMFTGKSLHTDLHVMNKSIFTDHICERMLEYATTR